MKGFIALFVVLSYVISLARADIFGPDNRRSPALGTIEDELSSAVAVAVLSSIIHDNDRGRLDIYADRLSSFMCKDERFASEPSIAYACTGFLVGPDLLLTAGHCSVNFGEVFNSHDLYCDSYAWMFDYKMSALTFGDHLEVSKDKVYRCKEIIYAVADEQAPYRDFALIRLERKVTDRQYLKLNFGNVNVGESVSMMGTPMGMPLKYTDAATIVENDQQSQMFVTNLDAFEGNSGSPVFNDRYEVTGILVSGSPSEATYLDKTNQCERYNRCDNDGKNCVSQITPQLSGEVKRGSEVQKLSKFRKLLEQYL